MTDNTHDVQIKMETRAQALVNAMANREYRNAIVHFDTNMTSLMPASRLEELWTAIQEKAGPFVSQISAHAAAGKPVVLLDCEFEKANLELYVTFDAAANVSGFHVGPELAPPIVAPDAPPAPRAKAPVEESASQ